MISCIGTVFSSQFCGLLEPQRHFGVQNGGQQRGPGHWLWQHGCWHTFISTYHGPSIADELVLHERVEPCTQVS